MTLILGIDEAGRGPVIGPMVMCGLLVDEKGEKKLESMGAKDSKMLTREQREALFGKIKSIAIDYKIVVIKPSEIDKAVGRDDGLNLNRLEARKSCLIIDELKPDKAYIDSPSNNVKEYKEYVRSHIKHKKVELIVEHKADVKFKSVSGASILAKVTRDWEIEKIKKQIGVDFGSGYLHDPKTIEFMKNNYEKHADIFRKSWFPYKELVNKKMQRSLEEFTSFIKEEPAKSPVLERMKKLEDFGYHFAVPKSSHELAIMKGPCTIILYKSGKLLIQGKDEVKKAVENLLK